LPRRKTLRPHNDEYHVLSLLTCQKDVIENDRFNEHREICSLRTRSPSDYAHGKIACGFVRTKWYNVHMAIQAKPNTIEASPKERRADRMNLRLPASAKMLLSKAAELSGLSLSEYVLQHSMEAAHQQMATARYSPLSETDTTLLAQYIDEPKAPSEGLERALATYRKHVVEVRD
jgi:uncharacterized protein (DUF1778 family)